MTREMKALLEIVKILEEEGIAYTVVGATARDIILDTIGIKPKRATYDLDFGIFVESWQRLEDIHKMLQGKPNVTKSNAENNKVRFNYDEILFDIVPFGGVAEGGKVHWPPHYDVIMTVEGYDEALKSSLDVEVGGQIIKVVCPESLVGLKLISWSENRSRGRDAEDIYTVFKSCMTLLSEAIYEDNNFEGYVETQGGDLELGCICLFGHRVKNILGDKGSTLILKAFEDRELLATAMIQPSLVRDQDEFDKCIKWIETFFTGYRK